MKQKGAEKVKNNLYFDADFNFLLLECEESSNNSIYLVFHTSEAANQVLKISVDGGAEQTEELESDADINLLLDGTYWAYDGDTTIYLSNSDGDSDPITITFPETIETSAALNKESDGAFLFQAQQESGGGSSADKMGVVYYINGRPYTVGTSQTRLAQITFTVGEITTALVACTFLAEITGVEDTAILTVRVRVNRNWEQFFEPKQTVSNGRCIVTFTFPQPDCSPTDANIVELYAYISEGSAYIDQQQFKASITASSLKSSSEWTGELVLDDETSPMTIEEVGVIELSDSVAAALQTPISITMADSTMPITIEEVGVVALADMVSVTAEDA